MHRWTSLFTLLFFFLTCHPARGDDRYTYLFADIPPGWPSELKCGTNQFPPFSYADQQGHARGIEVDVVNEVGRRLGLSFSIEVMPWPRLIEKMKTGQLDCMFAAFITDERKQFMDFTHVPLHVSRLTVYTHKDRAFPFARMDDLHGKRLGMIRDFKTVEALDQQLLKGDFAELVYGNNFEQLFEMLAQKRIDAVIVNDKVAELILGKRTDKAIVALPHALSSNAAFLTFTRQRDFRNLIARIDYALFEIVADGTYATLFKQQ